MLGHRRPFPARLGVYVAGALTPALIACSGPPPVPTPNPTVEALAAENERLRAGATSTAQAVAALAPTPQPTAAPTATLQPIPTVISTEDAVASVKQYTVLIVTDRGFGSGVSLGGGRILTAHHVVDDASQVYARFASGRGEPVRVTGIDPRRDLALLQSSFVDEAAAPFGDAPGLRQGAALLAVGYPRPDALGARDSTVTRGIYSARQQSSRGVWRVQTDTAFNEGSSGGPLADGRGRLVGVVTAGIRDSVGLNLAVASDEVQAFLAAPMQPPTARAAATLPPGPAATATRPPQPAAPPSKPAATLPVPTPTLAPPPTVAPRSASLGLQIRAPAEGTHVPERVIVQGVQARATPGGSHVWLLVIAAVDGGRWYPCPREIVARPDGTWSCELYLGGSAGVQHQIRVGVVDDAVHAFLARHVTTSPNQPIYPDQPAGSLPRGFVEEARVTVVRQ